MNHELMNWPHKPDTYVLEIAFFVRKHAFDIPSIVFDFDTVEKILVKVLKWESKFVYIRYGTL